MKNLKIGSRLDFIALLQAQLSSDVLIITDERVAPLYLGKIQQALEFLKDKKVVSCVLPEGEASKSLDCFKQIITLLLQENFHRDATLIALGGGVIGDLTGFVASVFMRGVAFIQIPTSLLAQVDASIGGKTAINHALGKNMIGAFYPPQAVFIDVSFLSTLSDDQFAAGMAEVIKHAFISEPAFFEFLESHQPQILARQNEILSAMVTRSCTIKAQIVEQDPQERNIRAFLNWGHTLGHAIEQCSDYQLLHGFAVSIGMHFALHLSCRWAGFPREKIGPVLNVLRAFRLPLLPSEVGLTVSSDALIKAMSRDKKNEKGQIRYVLLHDIGKPRIYPIETLAVKDALEQFLSGGFCLETPE